jgi:hypothetical protein
MVQSPLLECSFLIPTNRDVKLSDGRAHERWLWTWLDAELYRRFGGGTQSEGFYQGFYIDPDTNEKVTDRCLKFFVALTEDQVEELRLLLRGVCFLFEQKCIYLNVAGRVDFVKPIDE